MPEGTYRNYYDLEAQCKFIKKELSSFSYNYHFYITYKRTPNEKVKGQGKDLILTLLLLVYYHSMTILTYIIENHPING